MAQSDLEQAIAWANRVLANGLLDTSDDDKHLRLILSELSKAGRLLTESADVFALLTSPDRFGEASTGDLFLKAVALERRIRALTTPTEEAPRG